jgi:curved DNA-binding protein CbpA
MSSNLFSDSLKKISYYSILSVKKGATTQDIKKSYYKLALKYHPDKNAEDVKSKEMFNTIHEAYQVLGDEKKRRAYDRYGEVGLDMERDRQNLQRMQEQREEELKRNGIKTPTTDTDSTNNFMKTEENDNSFAKRFSTFKAQSQAKQCMFKVFDHIINGGAFQSEDFEDVDGDLDFNDNLKAEGNVKMEHDTGDKFKVEDESMANETNGNKKPTSPPEEGVSFFNQMQKQIFHTYSALNQHSEDVKRKITSFVEREIIPTDSQESQHVDDFMEDYQPLFKD